MTNYIVSIWLLSFGNIIVYSCDPYSVSNENDYHCLMPSRVATDLHTVFRFGEKSRAYIDCVDIGYTFINSTLTAYTNDNRNLVVSHGSINIILNSHSSILTCVTNDKYACVPIRSLFDTSDDACFQADTVYAFTSWCFVAFI